MQAPANPAYPTSDLRLRWVPAPAGASATPDEGALAAAVDAWLPGAQLLFGANPLGIRGGDGVMSYYEWRGDEGVESGVAALLVPTSGSGELLLLASRPQAAPCCADALPDAPTFAVVVEHLLAVYQVAARLCSPDASTDPQDAAFEATCITELQ